MPHTINLDSLLDRIATRQGGVRRVYAAPDPARTAHLVIDMQNGFMEEGAPVEVPEARSIVGNINRVSAAVRDAGGLNIFLRYTTAEGDTAWPVFMQRMGVDFSAAHRTAFTAGNHYWQLWPGLDLSPADLVLEKRRFSGFTPGTCPLQQTLQARGIDTLIVTGTLTNCCCESTVRDAMQHNYKVLMVADANAALSDEEHEATLLSLGWIFADLYDTDELVGVLNAVSADS